VELQKATAFSEKGADSRAIVGSSFEPPGHCTYLFSEFVQYIHFRYIDVCNQIDPDICAEKFLHFSGGAR
jgi:hypothetical protein